MSCQAMRDFLGGLHCGSCVVSEFGACCTLSVKTGSENRSTLRPLHFVNRSGATACQAGVHPWRAEVGDGFCLESGFGWEPLRKRVVSP